VARAVLGPRTQPGSVDLFSIMLCAAAHGARRGETAVRTVRSLARGVRDTRSLFRDPIVSAYK